MREQGNPYTFKVTVDIKTFGVGYFITNSVNMVKAYAKLLPA